MKGKLMVQTVHIMERVEQTDFIKCKSEIIDIRLQLISSGDSKEITNENILDYFMRQEIIK